MSCVHRPITRKCPLSSAPSLRPVQKTNPPRTVARSAPSVPRWTRRLGWNGNLSAPRKRRTNGAIHSSLSAVHRQPLEKAMTIQWRKRKGNEGHLNICHKLMNGPAIKSVRPQNALSLASQTGSCGPWTASPAPSPSWPTTTGRPSERFSAAALGSECTNECRANGHRNGASLLCRDGEGRWKRKTDFGGNWAIRRAANLWGKSGGMNRKYGKNPSKTKKQLTNCTNENAKVQRQGNDGVNEKDNLNDMNSQIKSRLFVPGKYLILQIAIRLSHTVSRHLRLCQNQIKTVFFEAL